MVRGTAGCGLFPYTTLFRSDGSFQVTVGAGSGGRTVTRLELRGGGVWDTDTATAHWALGATLGLDSALLNGGNGAVSFGVTDGSVFYVFAKDPSTVFSPGAVCTLTANFADGTTASATVTVPVIPTITSVTPSTGSPGTSPTVTVAGTSFQARSEERRAGKGRGCERQTMQLKRVNVSQLVDAT